MDRRSGRNARFDRAGQMVHNQFLKFYFVSRVIDVDSNQMAVGVVFRHDALYSISSGRNN